MKIVVLAALVVVLLLIIVAVVVGPRPTTDRVSQTTAADPSHSDRAPVHVLVGAGDIADCDESGDEETAALLDDIEGTVFTLGDNAYPDGTIEDFEECYDPSWGRHRERTKPAPGNHEYFDEDAEGYFDYFGSVAADGYYAYDLGEWRIYSLNSEDIDDEQLDWLTADLVENPRTCVLAYWHTPRFSSGGNHGGDDVVAPFWRALYQAGAEVVVSSHEHSYERFAPMDLEGERLESGLMQFVVGTGGGDLYEFDDAEPNSEVRWAGGHGVIKFELRSGEYSWEFVSVPGEGFRDSGSASCH